MSSNTLRASDYKPTFSGHETFPLRYGWLQKAHEAVVSAKDGADAIHIFRDPASIARFGLGRNMVGSLRYWAVGSGIIDDLDANGLAVSWLGEMLFGEEGLDPFLEEDAALWLLHWQLVGRERLTAFFWLFNEYSGGVFNRKDILTALMKLADTQEWPRVSETTVERDIQCLLRTYVGGRGGNEAGDSIMSELGLIRPLGNGRFSLARGSKSTLPNSVFLLSVIDYWNRSATDRSTLSYEALAFDGGSPGRAFLLDESSLIERLENLDRLTAGKIVWSETAGLRQLVRRGDWSEGEARDLIRRDLSRETQRTAA